MTECLLSKCNYLDILNRIKDNDDPVVRKDLISTINDIMLHLVSEIKNGPSSFSKVRNIYTFLLEITQKYNETLFMTLQNSILRELDMGNIYNEKSNGFEFRFNGLTPHMYGLAFDESKPADSIDLPNAMKMILSGFILKSLNGHDILEHKYLLQQKQYKKERINLVYIDHTPPRDQGMDVFLTGSVPCFSTETFVYITQAGGNTEMIYTHRSWEFDNQPYTLHLLTEGGLAEHVNSIYDDFLSVIREVNSTDSKRLPYGGILVMLELMLNHPVYKPASTRISGILTTVVTNCVYTFTNQFPDIPVLASFEQCRFVIPSRTQEFMAYCICEYEMGPLSGKEQTYSANLRCSYTAKITPSRSFEWQCESTKDKVVGIITNGGLLIPNMFICDVFFKKSPDNDNGTEDTIDYQNTDDGIWSNEDELGYQSLFEDYL